MSNAIVLSRESNMILRMYELLEPGLNTAWKQVETKPYNYGKDKIKGSKGK